MYSHGYLGPIGIIPAVVVAVGEQAPIGDPWGLVTQLGIGGVLVGFAVWLQDKFAKARKIEVDEERMITKARTDQLIDSLMEQIRKKD